MAVPGKPHVQLWLVEACPSGKADALCIVKQPDGIMGQAEFRAAADAGTLISRMLEERGAGADQQVRTLASQLTPDVANDVVHFLASLHGRFPSLIDRAAERIADVEARHWLMAATAGFAAERQNLVRMAVAAGPISSTPGHDESDAMLLHMARAFEMLATSDRDGCALGACIAFAVDWHAIRVLLDSIAATFDLDVQPCTLPLPQDSIGLGSMLATGAARSRAMLFGADQYLAQKQGLWALLAARRRARL